MLLCPFLYSVNLDDAVAHTILFEPRTCNLSSTELDISRTGRLNEKQSFCFSHAHCLTAWLMLSPKPVQVTASSSLAVVTQLYISLQMTRS